MDDHAIDLNGGADDEARGFGIRHGERRARQRRAWSRFAPDRRRAERRRQRIRTLILAAVAAAIPHAGKLRPAILLPAVSVSMNDFRAVPAHQAYDGLIKEASAAYDVDEDLIRAVMRAESSFNPLVVSPAGAQGLMQIMPGLSQELGVTDPFDPRQNIMAGARYLRQLLDAHRGNVRLTLASYNAGPGNVA
ncbi:MAG: lytic transglycosylase domain-containing protein, partial [Vicinamibacterales bacterium]